MVKNLSSSKLVYSVLLSLFLVVLSILLTYFRFIVYKYMQNPQKDGNFELQA